MFRHIFVGVVALTMVAIDTLAAEPVRPIVKGNRYMRRVGHVPTIPLNVTTMAASLSRPRFTDAVFVSHWIQPAQHVWDPLKLDFIAPMPPKPTPAPQQDMQGPIYGDEPAEQPATNQQPPEPPTMPVPDGVPTNTPASVPAVLSAELRMPQDAMVGDLVDIRLVTNGDITGYRWRIEPPSRGFRFNGAEAYFSDRTPGIYTVICAVAGNGGQADVAIGQVELVSAPSGSPFTDQDVQLPPQGTTLSQLARSWLVEVQSQNKEIEASQIGDVFLTVAGQYDQGLFNPQEDQLRPVERGVEIAIGPIEFQTLWGSFFAHARDYFAQAGQIGKVDEPAEFAQAYREIALVLKGGR